MVKKSRGKTALEVSVLHRSSLCAGICVPSPGGHPNHLRFWGFLAEGGCTLSSDKQRGTFEVPLVGLQPVPDLEEKN